MYQKNLLWLFAITSYFIVHGHGFEMNMTAYFRMPQMYDFDDYDRCLQEHDNRPATYCFVRADVLPANTSDRWQTIVNISRSDKHHFNHRHLYFGMCVEWCEATLARLEANATDDLFAGILSDNRKVNTYLQLFSMEEANRQRYNRLLNQCINLRLTQRYDLKAETVVEYCDTNRKTAIEQDSWTFTCHVTVFALVLLAVVCSLYDFYLKHKCNDKVLTARDHYKAPQTKIVHKIGVIFSIPRNWYRLTQEPNGKIGRDLRFLDSFKFFSMFLVIFAHTTWIIYESAINNPQDPEQLLHTVAGTYLMSGSLITVTFFVISGLLLTTNWLAVLKVKTKMSAGEYVLMFFIFNFVRYIRLTIPYAFVILMSGSYFDNPGGPMWRHIVEREQLSCRKNWWANLLYINTHYNTNERCMLQSWYLASDTHSFIVSLLILMIAHKWPKIRYYLFGSVIAISHLIPGIITYVKKFQFVFVPTPQTQRDSFVDDVLFAEFYTPSYMNFGCYFSGVLIALIYDQLTARQFNLRKYKSFQLLWYAMFPAGILWMFSSHPILQYYYEEPPQLWGSIYAAIQRNWWSFGLGIIIIGMASRVGWILRRCACLPIFRIMGRLTYGAFLLHVLVGRLVISTIRQPMFFGTGNLFAYIFFTMTASYLSSLVLAILLELPVSSALKILRGNR